MAVTTSILLLALCAARSSALSPQELAASYNLTTTTAWLFPPQPMNDSAANAFILGTPSWGVQRITENPQDMTFVADPFPANNPNVYNSDASPSNTSATVLAVNYPMGSFSHGTGGVQFDNNFDPTGTAGYQTMIVTYEIAFDQGFEFVQGGKLPGLRGGPNTTACSGGLLPDGTDCFSTRLMWRTLGSGEVYAYVPTPNNFCGQSNIRCNDDGYGISISRGVFSFTAGRWSRVTMLVELNDPGHANGALTVYYNDLLAIKMENMFYRSSDAINSIEGMYFSTFFGGSDKSWATPISQYTYFRNIQLWAGTAESNVTAGPVVNLNAASSRHPALGFALTPLLGAVVGGALLAF